MSCDNPNCSCGSNCSCGKGCNCHSPNLGFSDPESTTIIGGLARVNMYYEGAEMRFGGENGCNYGRICPLANDQI